MVVLQRKGHCQMMAQIQMQHHQQHPIQVHVKMQNHVQVPVQIISHSRQIIIMTNLDENTSRFHRRNKIVFNHNQAKIVKSTHYSTFLGMCELESEELLSDDSLLPNCQNEELGKCSICPAFTFLSKTEETQCIPDIPPHPQRKANF